MSKYSALTDHLAKQREQRVTMTFSDVERILGGSLPNSARTHRPWWANSSHGHVQARGWMDAGYESQDVDLATERLVFVRLNSAEPTETAQPAPPSPRGDHPLFGCMAGTIRITPGTDLTAPTMDDDEVEAMIDRKTRMLQGKQL